MANKGQKFKKYSPEIKEKILKEYFNGGVDGIIWEGNMEFPKVQFQTGFMIQRKALTLKLIIEQVVQADPKPRTLH